MNKLLKIFYLPKTPSKDYFREILLNLFNITQHPL